MNDIQKLNDLEGVIAENNLNECISEDRLPQGSNRDTMNDRSRTKSGKWRKKRSDAGKKKKKKKSFWDVFLE